MKPIDMKAVNAMRRERMQDLRMKAIVVLVIVMAAIAIPYVIRWENEPKFSKDLVWRGHWDESVTVTNTD